MSEITLAERIEEYDIYTYWNQDFDGAWWASTADGYVSVGHTPDEAMFKARAHRLKRLRELQAAGLDREPDYDKRVRESRGLCGKL